MMTAVVPVRAYWTCLGVSYVSDKQDGLGKEDASVPVSDRQCPMLSTISAATPRLRMHDASQTSMGLSACP